VLRTDYFTNNLPLPMNQNTSSMFDASISFELERRRLHVLHSLEIMDTPSDELFNDITKVAASLTKSGTACITFIDEERVWFKSRVGSARAEVARCDLFFASL